MTSTSTVRPPAVAGSFYPASAGVLAQTLRDFLQVAPAPPPGPVPKALIVPHAGYVYSGPIAATAYRRIIGAPISRVVLLGPTHRVWVRGLAVPSVDGLATPLGMVPVDRALRESLAGMPQVVQRDDAHEQEHALEVQLPFLQICLGAFQVLPLVVGEATAEEVGAVLERVWGGPETLIVISSDLSHYLDYQTGRRLDQETARRIVAREAELDHERACGATPVSGLLWVARKRGLQVSQLDLRSSGDTAGDRRRVVGYGAFALQEANGGQP